jgi:quinol-cytochrome oxidoreductase complex cytochrome b subunit/coenzyme F420-reducing hydrogenase delta subunit
VAIVKRALLRTLGKSERIFEYAFGQRLNPFTWLGALGWYFYWITAATGIYLYIFFDTGIVDAYASVEYITNDQWYAAGVMRSLHRYASDALVVVVVLHLLREFAMDRLRGKHFFAWITGTPLLVFIYICGISGYWLVWDTLAQYIAVATTEWLDTLPFFAEPIANNFLDSGTLGGRFFTLMVLIHIFAPLFMLLLMWVHVQRHSGARVNPPRPLAFGTLAALLVLSLAYPAVSQGPADLDTVPTSVNLDWFYLAGYPLLDMIPGGQLWLYLAVGFALLAFLPWLPAEKEHPIAKVSLANCNGCSRCEDDCPFSAVTMLPRSDGRPYELEPVVNVDNCTSCGVCVGACPTSTPFRRARPIEPGIELPHRTISSLREAAMAPMVHDDRGPRVIVFACDHSDAWQLEGNGVRVIALPCVGMLPPSFVDFTLSRNLAQGVMLAGSAENDCYHRLGNEWTLRRMARERDPYLRERVPLERVALNWLPPGSVRRRAAALEAFRDRLGRLSNA